MHSALQFAKHTSTLLDPPKIICEVRRKQGLLFYFTDGKAQTQRGGVTYPESHSMMKLEARHGGSRSVKVLSFDNGTGEALPLI